MVFHIARRQDWDAPPYEPASLNTEGFIHFSAEHQVAKVRQRYYEGVEDLVLLVVDETRTGPWKWEDSHSNGEVFPHLYGPLDRGAVIEVRAL